MLTACLPSLSALQHLGLRYSLDEPVLLSGRIQWPCSLQSIELEFRVFWHGHVPLLTSLRRCQGCTAAVSITARADPCAGPFVALLTQLAELDTLDKLSLHGGCVCKAVSQALRQIRCRLFCWTCTMREDWAVLRALPQAAQVVLRCPDTLRIAWAALSTRPGSFAIAAPVQWDLVEVLGVGPAPSFEEPWAIWVQHQHGALGLPWYSFRQLPSGWWVWHNATAACLDMQAPGDGGDWGHAACQACSPAGLLPRMHGKACKLTSINA